MLKLMSKGAWAVVAIFLLYGGFLPWMYERDFLQGNVWSEHRIEEADRIEEQVGFLGLRVAKFVGHSVGAVFTCLLIAFIYLAIQIRRIERRMEDSQGRTGQHDRGR